MNFNQLKPFAKKELFFTTELQQFFNLDNLEKGIDCYLFDKIPSTNSQLWDLINQGISLPVVAIACQQTAGKGQRGHQWESKLGGLYLSLALEVNLPVNCANHLTLCTAWGIVNNLRKYQIPVQIKWLNDLILDNKKLGGILTETRINNNSIKQVVIGVGINFNNDVPEVGINLQSLLKKQPNSSINSLEKLSLITIEGILTGYQHYITEGINNLINYYEQLLYNLGEKIALEIGTGIITGITTKGELRVRLKSHGASTEIYLPPSI